MVKLQNPGYVFIAQFAVHLSNSSLTMTLLLALVAYQLFHFMVSFRLKYIFSLPDYLHMYVLSVHDIHGAFLFLDYKNKS